MHPETNEISNLLSGVDREKAPDGLQERILRACDDSTPVDALGCDEALEMASEYIDGELTGARRDAFEAHVFACDACYQAYREMERVAGVLRETPAAAAPADMHERIMGAVDHEREAEASPTITWQGAAKVLGGLAAAAAHLAAVFVPRGNDVRRPDAPAVAELPATTSEAISEDQPAEPVVEDSVEQSSESEAPEPATTEPTTEPRVARVEPSTTSARASRPATPGASEPVAHSEAPDDVSSEPSGTPTVTESAASAGSTEAAASSATDQPAPRPNVERTEPAAAPERESTVADEQPEVPSAEETPRPVRDDEGPETSPGPPARETDTRETAVAAMPEDSGASEAGDGGEAGTVSTEPVPSSTTVTTEKPPKPGTRRQPTRLAVVPRQPKSRTVFRAEGEPPPDRLTRMAANINSAQTPEMDNPPMGIELN